MSDGAPPGGVERDVELLLTTVVELHRAEEPSRLLPIIVDRVIELTGAERGLLLLRGGDGLETRLARGRAGEELAEVAGTSQSIPRQVLESGEPVCIAGTPADWSQASRSMRTHSLCSVLCAPIRSRGAVQGVLYVDSQEATREFGPLERTFLEALAAQCAVALERAQRRREEQAEREALDAEHAALRRGEAVRPLSANPAMQALLRRVERVADSDLALLITGETGVGKEVLARYVHACSHRRAAPLVVVDCGAIPEALLESVLFGHRRGAFTGATHDQEGLVARGEGGTVLLDEVGELPLGLQPKLLRFLEERSYLPVGSSRRLEADVRVVASTHRDLGAMVAEGSFREDLYHRLHVIELCIPPLRERPEDVGPLARLILARERHRARAPQVASFTLEALAALRAHPWPGNVRELTHRIQKALVLAETSVITVADLELPSAPDGAAGVLPLKEARREASHRFEREYVSELLARHRGRVQEAAREAAVSRQMFHRLMARHDISRHRFRQDERAQGT